MQLWQDGLIAMLAAIGVASLMWAAVKAVLYPGAPRRQNIVALVTAQGDGEQMEQQVRTLRRIRQEQRLFGSILLVDCGLNEEGKKISRLLERQDRWVTLCTADEISRYISCG